MTASTPAPLDSLPTSVDAFLQDDAVRRVADYIRLTAEQTSAVLADLPRLRSDDLLAHFRSLHQRMFVSRESLDDEIGNWPTPDKPAGADLPPCFYALLFMSGAAAVRAEHARRGITDEVTRATLGDLAPWLEDYRKNVGHYGLRQLPWLNNHYSGQLYSLGRLQFLFEDFDHPFRWYVHAAGTRPPLLLAEAGLPCDPHGVRLRAESTESAAFSTTWHEDAQSVTAHALTPEARVNPTSLRLDKSDWRQILRQGSPMLSVHITATGPLTPEGCADSYRRAADFFPRHFSDRRVHAYTCFSWLLDPALANYLRPDSNIVRFQTQFQRFLPGDANDSQFRGLYPEAWSHPDECTPRTSLQQALHRHLRSGGLWALHGGIVLPAHGGLAIPL